MLYYATFCDGAHVTVRPLRALSTTRKDKRDRIRRPKNNAKPIEPTENDIKEILQGFYPLEGFLLPFKSST